MAVPQKVEASMMIVYNPNPVSFYGGYGWNTFYGDGQVLYIEATTTASDNVSREVWLTVYVYNDDAEFHIRTYSDGYTKYVDGIPLNGGSGVGIAAYCSDSSVEITMDLYINSYTPNS